MPKSLKRKAYYAGGHSSADQEENSVSARRRRRMAELETELAALKAAEMYNVDTTRPTTSPVSSGTPPPSATPQEELFARLPQSRAKTILGMALRLPTEKT